jgi:hypothetical protein
LKLHVAEQVRIYGDTYFVNLVNNKGHELPVKDAMEKALKSVGHPQAHYVYFDFHHECRGLRFERIQLLVDSLHQNLADMGYFHLNAGSDVTSAKPTHRQTGVIRSNCMDCLDRTNVTQAALAKDALQRQLRSIGVLSFKEGLDDHPGFISVFRNGKLPCLLAQKILRARLMMLPFQYGPIMPTQFRKPIAGPEPSRQTLPEPVKEPKKVQ